MSCETNHNHQPTTNRAQNELARPGKNANFWPNLDVLGQKILFFTGEIKSFVTHITKKQARHLFCIVFGRALDKMGNKCHYLAQGLIRNGFQKNHFSEEVCGTRDHL